ncbi:hypothetical protein TTHERM_00317526 (macronuclear) [Tetrahymena thermophila SB210]|uniref:Uncharacterized protein n=1 Tax=Tetrahymena thermophila (strain SB210) TaxID=312017 RepID=A4VD84_TETTS|nr:hypothetical protein TTHERM_00317526 [Tetrahymena thermophila SB210]EDK31490.2 hypothetical protein TTHERM_00317526 [Tetrahymena thermophila SB210]|eukprot:XP_001470935.2 hypothetical protein TTHERM_00317526 [Tetrahymena thermophila SB210]
MNKIINSSNKKSSDLIQNSNNNNNNQVKNETTGVRSLNLKKNGKEFIPNQANTGASNNEQKKNTLGLGLLSKIIPKRNEPQNDIEQNSTAINIHAAPEKRQQEVQNSIPKDQKEHQMPKIDLTNRSLIQKQQNQSKSLIRRTSSSIDEKQRSEAQTPTLTANKNGLLAAPGIQAKMPEIKLNLNSPQKPQTEAKLPENKTLLDHTFKPTLNVKACLQKQQQIKLQSPPEEAQKREQQNKISQNKLVDQVETQKSQTVDNLSNAQVCKQLIQLKNPLLNSTSSVFSNIINEQHLQQKPQVSQQANEISQKPKIQTEEQGLLGKRSASSLNHTLENDKEATEKKVKPNTDNTCYQELKQDIIKEMEVEEDSHDDSTSSICSNATVVLNNYNNQNTQQKQEQETSAEISRKASDLSDDSQKLLGSPETISNSQEMIIREMKKQRKRSEQLELKNKINENLKLIENKKEKIHKIVEIIQEKLSPETMKILKEHIQKQKDILYQTSSISQKKQNKINVKLLNHMLQNNVQFLQNLKI